MKRGGDVILPLTEDNRLFIAYSEKGRAGRWNLPDAAFTAGRVSEITAEGNRPLCSCTVENGSIELKLKPGQAVVIAAD